jgi:hypothetical protein
LARRSSRGGHDPAAAFAAWLFNSPCRFTRIKLPTTGFDCRFPSGKDRLAQVASFINDTFQQPALFLYLQDDYKVSQKLTVNLGITTTAWQ